MRASNSSELIDQKEEEIQTATRDAYLYAVGITLLTFLSVLLNTWAFYVGQLNGMMCRIMMTMAIYSKVYKIFVFRIVCARILKTFINSGMWNYSSISI